MNDQAVLPAGYGQAVLPADAAPAPPSALFIFGGYGDLTKRLLMPSLYNLAHEGVLDGHFDVIGVDHIEGSTEDFRNHLTESVHQLAAAGHEIKEPIWNWLVQRIDYLSGDFENPETYDRIRERLEKRMKEAGDGNAVFYFAVAPRFFSIIAEQLGAAGLMQEGDKAFRRIVIEKPFGTDLASARALNRTLLSVGGESQIYRIDHFLGKETVQNVMAFRFGNGIFEPIWNRDHVEHVQITAAETVGVEKRARFYDATGALRDMVPNHIFQLLAMTAMEPPNSFDADAVRTEKAKVIEAVRRIRKSDAPNYVVRGQYRAGTVLGQHVADYRREPDVDPSSRTETYVAMKCFVDNWRWNGVPFYIRTGKSLAVRRTEIAIHFKRAPGVLFRDKPDCELSPNVLVINVQPDEGISLRFAAKVPGRRVRLSEVDMDFRYADYFKAAPSTGYETLIYDCLSGDPTLFQRADNIEAGWSAVEPILQATSEGLLDIHGYVAGTSGPVMAEVLLAQDGFQWLPLEQGLMP
ncbi:glucose-6-phosphate dehydrogenase [Ancylobacter sp. 6x-1]|uniref:Glucose-6-phosphate 1-dehydrogenase n=1 Tax=Ancylobacter crimeensis TaxID=2579147 RepID=A0ABT0DBW0_9HYPH|nr:glucose-6-phosphate dehydrogenase [Ancylobacter crimeensis]MCK0197448.1 glucose-6-phosphate dehydrogenase [Ancylobacter crimeensis]